MGQGIRTMLAAVVGRKLGISAEMVTVEIGDGRVAPHLTAGSWGTAIIAAEVRQKALNPVGCVCSSEAIDATGGISMRRMSGSASRSSCDVAGTEARPKDITSGELS
jgi:hypothetical protein